MSSILDSFRLNGKTAVVTGAARGLGQGMALALAEAGADIVAVDILTADDTRQQVEALGRQCLTLTANLGDRAAIPGLLATAQQSFDSLDILVNCAGIIRREDFVNFTEKDWDDVMGINIDAVFFLSQIFVRQALARQATAKIINIASMLSFQGGIRVPSYTASKSAVQGLTRLIASELGGKGINCNAIAPGYMATDNTAPLRADADRSADSASTPWRRARLTVTSRRSPTSSWRSASVTAASSS
ncbi:MAG: SDR family NAD(P)-dependent oxidoreductase, partial [Verrucomicrobia bacterium]|nr:SDR family NAD(P)-dependent oxidoreductase [Verrucomicrobiota bacterium]